VKSEFVKVTLPYSHEDAVGERRYSPYSFFTSELDEGEWLSCPHYTFPLGKGPPWYLLDKGWVDLSASLYALARRKILYTCQGLNPGP
jgi:hypothetical protein